MSAIVLHYHAIFEQMRRKAEVPKLHGLAHLVK